MTRPKPDWRGKTKQPKGSAGPKPRPNGRVVATKPVVTIEVPCKDGPTIQNLDVLLGFRPERPEDV